MYTISDNELKHLSKIVYQASGINLTPKKRFLIISRLSGRLQSIGLRNFSEYIELLNSGNASEREMELLINAISTNYSTFFRENHHFEFLKNEILPGYLSRTIRIWSAACSTGQEIYSVLIALKQFNTKNPHPCNYRLYASDISTKVLQKAANGIYSPEDAEKLDKKILTEYFLRNKENANRTIKVKKKFSREITFFKLNLMDQVYNIPKMDVVFLRNAIIYFDKETKLKLVKRLHDYIVPGGYLILGHSESLFNLTNSFSLVGKTIYRREP